MELSFTGWFFVFVIVLYIIDDCLSYEDEHGMKRWENPFANLFKKKD